jgi:hypothetical protein
MQLLSSDTGFTEKLTHGHLVKKWPVVNETRRSVAVSTTAIQQILAWDRTVS